MRKHAVLAGLVGAAMGCGGGTEPNVNVPCVPGTDGVPVSLASGEVQRFSDPATIACLAVNAVETGSEYVMITANGAEQNDLVRDWTVEFTAAPAAAASVQRSDAAAAVEIAGARESVQLAFETALRKRERELLERGGVRGSWPQRYDAAGTGANRDVSIAQATEGTRLPFRVPDADGSNLCTSYINIGAEVRKVGAHVIIVEDTLSPANGFTDADYDAIAAEFDALIYQTEIEYFGDPSDINTDTRIYVLFTPEVNKLTPRGSLGLVAGFFWGGDLFPRTGSGTTCEQSNEAEIFYLLAPDPQGQFSDPRTTEKVREGTRGTIAHEFQHMINQGVRMALPQLVDIEEVWLNEALSHFAEEIVGRKARGFGDFEPLSDAMVKDVANGYRDYDAFFYQNLARFRLWLVRPDTSAPTSDRTDRQLAPRGAAWALLRWTADHFAGTDLPAFTRALVAGPGTGIPNLTSHAGVSWDSLFVGWMVANYAEELPITGLDPLYTYESWHLRNAIAGSISTNTYGLRVRDLDDPHDSVGTRSRSATGSYYRWNTGPTASDFTFQMLGKNGAQVTFQDPRVFILRTQ